MIDAGLRTTPLARHHAVAGPAMPSMTEDATASGRSRLPAEQGRVVPLMDTLEAIKPA